MAAWLPPNISHHDLLPHTLRPSPAVNSRPPPGTAVPSLRSSSQLFTFPGLASCPGCIGLQQGIVRVVLAPFRLSQISHVLANNLKCFSSVPNSYPDMGIRPQASFTAQVQQVQSCLTLPPFFSLPRLSYRVLRGLYMFLSGGQIPARSQLVFCI